MSGIHYTEEERRALIEATSERFCKIMEKFGRGILKDYECYALANRTLLDTLDRLSCSEIVVKYRELKETLK